MKYVTPKYEVGTIEAKDVLTASADGYEIEKSDEGNGSILLEFSKLFG